MFRPNATILIGPQPIIWIFLAGPAALFSAGYIRERFQLFRDPRDKSTSIRVMKVHIVLSVFQIVFIVAAFKCYARFEPDRLVINSMTSLGGEIDHPYTDIDRIIISAYYGGRHGGKGSRQDRLHLIFHDGTQWENINAGWWSINDDPALLKQVLDFLQAKTGKAVEHVDTIESSLEHGHRPSLHPPAPPAN